MADSIFVEDIDFRIMAKGFLGKYTIDAAFGQFRSILKYVGWMRGKFVAEVDHKGSSQTCPNCRIEVRKELGDRIHSCPECRYVTDRDIASAQELCNRGQETYPGTPEKQRQLFRRGRRMRKFGARNCLSSQGRLKGGCLRKVICLPSYCRGLCA